MGTLILSIFRLVLCLAICLLASCKCAGSEGEQLPSSEQGKTEDKDQSGNATDQDGQDGDHAQEDVQGGSSPEGVIFGRGLAGRRLFESERQTYEICNFCGGKSKLKSNLKKAYEKVCLFLQKFFTK